MHFVKNFIIFNIMNEENNKLPVMNSHKETSMRNIMTIALPLKAEELLAAEVKRMREAGLCASKKMVAANCIYQVLGRQGEAQ